MLRTDGYDIAEIMIIIEKEAMCEWYHTFICVCAMELHLCEFVKLCKTFGYS